MESIALIRAGLLTLLGREPDIEVVAAHADGFVAKHSDPDKITEAIHRVAAGKKALDPDLAFYTLNSPASPLTPREIDVLRLAAQGELAMEIADKLYLSVATVRNYTSRVIGKTGARNRVDAIRIAEGAGWLQPGAPTSIARSQQWPAQNRCPPSASGTQRTSTTR
jgi:two-component system, NarL family, response regulator DesR